MVATVSLRYRGASVVGALSPFSPPPVTVHVIVHGTRDGKAVPVNGSSGQPRGLGCSLASPVPYSPNGVRDGLLQSPTAPSKRGASVGTQGSPLGRGSAGEAQGSPRPLCGRQGDGAFQAGPPGPLLAATPGRWLRQSWASFPQLQLKGADWPAGREVAPGSCLPARVLSIGGFWCVPRWGRLLPSLPGNRHSTGERSGPLSWSAPNNHAASFKRCAVPGYPKHAP